MRHLLKNVVVVLSLLALGAMATWITLRPRIPRGDGFTDGEQLLAATSARDELRLARWEEPTLLDSLGRDGEGAREPFLDVATGRLFFARGDAGGEELWQATPEGGGWVVRPLAELNSPRRETAPCLHDGWLWFASDRAGGLGGLDLWRAPLSGDRFLAPENVGAPINSSADETDPALRPDGELWYASNRDVGGEGDFDLLAAKGDGMRFAPPLFADGVNSPFDERAPAFASDGRLLVFASDRSDGAGGFDLWRALRRDGAFAQPQNLGAPNSGGDESGPTLGDDGFTLLYAATPAPGEPSELRRTRTRELFAVAAPRFTLADFTILLLLALVALLAWLARRWEALDLLWKCMVVSLLLHLLFLWWSQRVDVEASAPNLRGPGRTYDVRLLGDLLATVARLQDRARGDAVAPASSLPQASALTRATALPEAAEAQPAAATEAIERSAAASDASAPDARPRDVARRSAPAMAASHDPVAPVAESFERRSGELRAPSLAAAEAGSAGPVAPATAHRVALASDATGLSAASEPAARIESSAPARAAGGDAPIPTAAARGLAPATRDRAARGERPVALATPDDRAESGEAAGGASGAPAALELAPSRGIGGEGAAVVAAGAALPARAKSSLAGDAGVADFGPRGEAPLAGGRVGSDAAAAEGPPATGAKRGTAERKAGAAPAVEIAAMAREGGDGEHGSDDEGDGDEKGGATGGSGELALAPSLAPGAAGRRAATTAAPTRASMAGGGEAPDAMPLVASIALPLAAPARLERGDDVPAAPATPRLYERRFGEAKGVALREGGGSEATERAVLSGLRYLAKVQDPKGFFGDARAIDLKSKYRDVRVGKTALATLAFMGAGHTHRSESEFSLQVARALSWLMSRQDQASGHFGNSESYSHGIATYALAECYAMTKDPTLVTPLERALDHLLAMQVVGSGDPRKEGGWTYYYPDGPGFDEFPRASISAWQVMALESAKVGGFEVPDASLAAAKRYFLGSFDPSFDGFRYTHNPSWVNGSYGTLPASTPASMFALVLLGEGGHPRVAEAEGYVLDRQPSGWRWRGQDAFVRRGQANVYFMYYSTLALFCRGGDAWRAWNRSLQQSLLPAQQRDGSWEEIDLYARDYALDDADDRAYTTAMCVLMLEVYYRYFTPLLGDRLGK